MDSEISKLNQKIQQDALFIQDLRKEQVAAIEEQRKQKGVSSLNRSPDDIKIK